MLVEQGADEGARAPIAGPIQDGLGECASGGADARAVAFVGASEEVDEAREDTRQLERDGEERADRWRGRYLGLRGEKPPVGRPGRRRGA